MRGLIKFHFFYFVVELRQKLHHLEGMESAGRLEWAITIYHSK